LACRTISNNRGETRAIMRVLSGVSFKCRRGGNAMAEHEQSFRAEQALQCVDCFKSFEFTPAEQQFFAAKGLMNSPKRCVDCRILLRAWRQGLTGTTAEAICTKCGIKCRLPFIPKGHSPIFCSTCLHERRMPQLPSSDSIAQDAAGSPQPSSDDETISL
jgi:CxxC-x17-CxxC domain-containing protein